MLFFFDETFRSCRREPQRPFGALCGIGIPEASLAPVAEDLFQIKRAVMGRDFAEGREVKGKELFKNWVFKLQKSGQPSRNLELGERILKMIARRKLPVFGTVCFDPVFAKFQVDDVASLDRTFFYLFERIDMWMKIHHPSEKALLVFDDRDYGINQKNAEAITRFFQRSTGGGRLDSIVQTPFFAISQTHNAGLQLADIVTTIIGLRFEGSEDIKPHFQAMRRSIPEFEIDLGRPPVSGLKILRDGHSPGNRYKKKAPDGPMDPRSGQESPTSGAMPTNHQQPGGST